MKIKCPRCGTLADYDTVNPWRPFCSERCKLIDLGEWVSEKNRIVGESAADDSTPVQSDNFRH